MRYLSQQLERAEKILDRRLDIARQRKDEVGFIGETLTAANRASPVPSSFPFCPYSASRPFTGV